MFIWDTLISFREMFCYTSARHSRTLAEYGNTNGIAECVKIKKKDALKWVKLSLIKKNRWLYNCLLCSKILSNRKAYNYSHFYIVFFQMSFYISCESQFVSQTERIGGFRRRKDLCSISDKEIIFKGIFP